jgi:glutamyl-tRNA synthetase
VDCLTAHYLRLAHPDRVADELRPRLAEMGIDAARELVGAAPPLVQERSRTLEEAASMLRFLFQELEPSDKAEKLTAGQEEYLREVAERLASVGDWTVDSIREALTSLAEERGLSKTKAFQPVRAAVTFSNVSPPLFESMALLGRDRSLERVRRVAA